MQKHWGFQLFLSGYPRIVPIFFACHLAWPTRAREKSRDLRQPGMEIISPGMELCS